MKELLYSVILSTEGRLVAVLPPCPQSWEEEKTLKIDELRRAIEAGVRNAIRKIS